MSNYDRIPVGVKRSIDRWVSHGEWPGESSFVRAVLENRLMQAFQRADDWSLGAMRIIASYVYNEIPMPSWGSPEKMVDWAARFKPVTTGETGEDRLLGPGDEVPR